MVSEFFWYSNCNKMRNLKFFRKYIPTLRIKKVSRILLDRQLKKLLSKIKPGITLDVGSKHSPYKKYLPHTKYFRLDIEKTAKPDILCDIHQIKWKSNFFDTIIATEVLEHLYEPQKAVNEIHRILKPGGTCILSTRFIYPYHPDPKDYYRFTQDSLNYLFRNFSNIKIYSIGNRIQTAWEFISTGYASVILNIFNPLIALINFKDKRCASGFIVKAIK